MAGVAGIIRKNSHSDPLKYNIAFASMMQNLSVYGSQKRDHFSDENILCGNVVPVSHNENDRYVFSVALNIVCVIEGVVFFNEKEKADISHKYKLPLSLSDQELLPYAYHFFKSGITECLTGIYNIFLYNRNNREVLLFNDRLGQLPLYIYESYSVFMFSSKIESLLASGLMPKVELDAATLAEHLLFNYPISDYSYIKNIKTLPNASMFSFENGVVRFNKYWDMAELYGQVPADKKESFALLNQGLKSSLEKITRRYDLMNMSLTGGWDSRVVLSYLLPEYKNKLHLYSFGAKDSDDISVPLYIAEKEGLNYTPYVLDENYLKEFFLPTADSTIKRSGGTRNYKRTHYLYAIQQIASVSEILITGIFGDEVFKVGKPSGGAVLSANTIHFIENDFNSNKILQILQYSPLLKLIKEEPETILNEIRNRLSKIQEGLKKYDSLSEKYYAFRFETNLRKYFGNECGSYNDFVDAWSPFTDHDFLTIFSKTKYFGTNYSFHSNNILHKRQSTLLYYRLVRENYQALAHYNSSRPFSMHEAATLPGNIKILYHKYLLKKQRKIDGFNTGSTDLIFYDNMMKSNAKQQLLKKINPVEKSAADVNSLYYWLNYITQNYL